MGDRLPAPQVGAKNSRVANSVSATARVDQSRRQGSASARGTIADGIALGLVLSPPGSDQIEISLFGPGYGESCAISHRLRQMDRHRLLHRHNIKAAGEPNVLTGCRGRSEYVRASRYSDTSARRSHPRTRASRPRMQEGDNLPLSGVRAKRNFSRPSRRSTNEAELQPDRVCPSWRKYTLTSLKVESTRPRLSLIDYYCPFPAQRSITACPAMFGLSRRPTSNLICRSQPSATCCLS